MFGIGWTEMLVIGVVALVVIGPKELPGLMQRLGKMVAAVRRVGNDFQREINKAAGLEAMTDIRRSIAEPLKQTAAQIRSEFNKPLAGGGVAPSGAIAPKNPASESVVAEIHEKIGAPPIPAAVVPTIPAAVAPTIPAAVAPTIPAAVAPTIPAAVAPTIPAAVAPPARKPRARKTPIAEGAPLKPPRKPRAKKPVAAETNLV